MSAPSLAELERRFAAIATGRAPLSDAAELVHEGLASAVERMHVYAHAYVVRIALALTSDHPKLAHALGETEFAELCRRYVAARPPRHPSLREAGADLARFLDGDGPPTWQGDLARLERARLEAFDGPDQAVLARAALAAIPPEAIPMLRLQLVPTARLLELAWNADDIWSAIEDAVQAPPPRLGPRAVLVWRRGIEVIHRTVEFDEAEALRAVTRGATFAEMCDALAGGANDPAERAVELTLRWIDAECLGQAVPVDAPSAMPSF